MKSPVELQNSERPEPSKIPPFAITGTKSGTAFDVRVATREEAEELSKDFRKQGAQDVTISEIG